MIKSAQKLLFRGNTTTSAFIKQAMFFESTSAGNAPARFQLNYKPQPIDHKLWKNGLEVSRTSTPPSFLPKDEVRWNRMPSFKFWAAD